MFIHAFKDKEKETTSWPCIRKFSLLVRGLSINPYEEQCKSLYTDLSKHQWNNSHPTRQLYSTAVRTFQNNIYWPVCPELQTLPAVIWCKHPLWASDLFIYSLHSHIHHQKYNKFPVKLAYTSRKRGRTCKTCCCMVLIWSATWHSSKFSSPHITTVGWVFKF